MILQAQYVEIEIFVTVGVAIFGLIVAGFGWMLNKLSLVKDSLSAQTQLLTEVKKENESDRDNIDALWETTKANIQRMDALEKQRTVDVIQFTEVIGKLNTTLGKMEVTLENTNTVMVKVEKRLEDQDKEIKELKNK